MNAQHVLVTLDGSALAESALPVARMLAGALGADVTLFSALTGVCAAGAAREPIEYLQHVARDQHALGIDARIAFRIGDPAEKLLELLSETAFDAVLMATHSRHGPARALLGSLADQIVRASPVPVVLLHANFQRSTKLQTILVPLDGSTTAASALAEAIPLARAAHATVILVRVSAAQLYATSQAYIQATSTRLRHAGVNALGMAVWGEPAAGIARAIEQVDPDLVVMSTHARTGPARSLLGSVADEVVRHAGRPVMLVRPGMRTHDWQHEVTTDWQNHSNGEQDAHDSTQRRPLPTESAR